MNKNRLQQYRFKLLFSLVIVGFLGSLVFKKQIMEHKVTKTKVEVMKRMSQSKPSEWGREIKDVLDSLMTHNQDSISSE